MHENKIGLSHHATILIYTGILIMYTISFTQGVYISVIVVCILCVYLY